MNFLLDTNVLSELRKGPQANEQVRASLDMLIAATAIANGLVLVTRNIADCAGTGIDLLDPWTYKA